jgi:tyrosine-protein kinase Etk/Wzc
VYLHSLDSLLIDLKIESAADRQRFLEVELSRRAGSIAELDSAMTDFMVEHGVIEIENQARAALEVAAKLRAQLSMLDIERQLLAMTLKPGSHELEMITMEVEKLRNELARFREGGGEGPQIFPPLDRFPDLASEYIRLFTERSLHEFAQTYIQLKLEDAKVAAVRRVSVIRVIDPPVLPERRAWPKRKQIVMIATIAAFLWVSFFLLVRERWREGYFAPDRLEGQVPPVDRTVEGESRNLS